VDKIDDLMHFGIRFNPEHIFLKLGIALIELIVWVRKGFVFFRPGVNIPCRGSIEQNLADPSQFDLTPIWIRTSPIGIGRIQNLASRIGSHIQGHPPYERTHRHR
jgi:hypothetical protein